MSCCAGSKDRCTFFKLKVTTGSVNKVSRLCLVEGMQDLIQQIGDNIIVDVRFTIFDCL